MKTPIVRTWKMALGSQVFDDARKFSPDRPTMANIVIAGEKTTAEARTRKPVLPLGCVFAVRYSSRQAIRKKLHTGIMAPQEFNRKKNIRKQKG